MTMKLLFVTATAVMAVFAAAPGAVASVSKIICLTCCYPLSQLPLLLRSCNANPYSFFFNLLSTIQSIRGVHNYDSESSLSFDEKPQDSTFFANGSGGSPFDDGLRAGRSEANMLWRHAGGTCSAAWREFPDSVNRRINDKGWNNSGNWRTRAFNQGARAGMNEVVTQKEKECFHDSADECVDLGDTAARILAYNHCGKFTTLQHHSSWRRECRAAAIDQCRAQVRNEVRNGCGSPSTQDLRILKSKCWNQVLTMIGDLDHFEAY